MSKFRTRTKCLFLPRAERASLYLLGSFVLLSLFLASCQNADNQNPVNNQTGNTGNATGELSSTSQSVKVDPGTPSQQSQQVATNNLLKLQDQLNEVVKTGKIDGCKEIKDPTYNESCQVYILVSQATSKTDTKVCDAGATARIKDLCKGYVGQKK